MTGSPSTDHHESLVDREVALPGGRRLVVRRAASRDLAGVRSLFAGLSPEDSRRRFFSSYRPDDPFLLRLLGQEREGGGCLVAEVTMPDGGKEIVAEADFCPLPDGDAELSITIGSRWRGWLGPYLLDALVGEAAARGIHDLQAEILVGNRPMIALVHARGYAVIDRDDLSTVRVVIPTDGPTPGWPGPHERPRVLVELPGARWHATPELRRAGFDVMTCPGPRPGRNCPLLDGGTCALVAGADVVVHALPARVDGSAELLGVHRAHCERRPLVIERRSGRGTEEDLGTSDGRTAVLGWTTADEVLEAIRSLLATDAVVAAEDDAQPGT